MVFDFTKEIKLNKRDYKVYKRLQIGFYVSAALLGVYFSYLILFPTAYFYFSFPNPNSLKNTIISPRSSENQASEGKISQGLYFDTALVGNYSRVKINVNLDKKSDPIEDGQITIQKSQQAFFYPEEKSFDFPASAPTFKVGEDYYLLKDNKLARFISEKAFLTRYRLEQAQEKDASFLKNYELSKELIGFSDGTLISYGISAYIVSEGKILPINNVTTFSAMGYDWSDVIAVSGLEMSLYEKDKLFTISSPHPAGSIFKTVENEKYYFIKDRKKYEIDEENAYQILQGRKPILVSMESLNNSANCQLQKNSFSARNYSCEIPLEEFKDLYGKDYEFKLTTGNEIEIEELNISFEKAVNFENMKGAASDIVNKIKGNYVETPTQ